MSKLFKFSVFIVCFGLAANVSLAQKSKSKIAPKPLAQKKVDLGKLDQNTYTNDFFELKIEFPFGWLVGDNTLEAQLLAIQKGMVQTKNAKNQAALNQAMNRVTPLLGGYKELPGSSTENSNLRIVVENLSSDPKIKTGKDYLNAMINTLKLTTLPSGFTYSAIKSEMIDSKEVDYIETKYLNSQKRSYVLVRKGFAVVMTIDAYNPEDFEALHKVLTEIDLNYKK